MKTKIKNFLLQIYYFWFPITLGSVIARVFICHDSKWWLVLPFIIWALFIAISVVPALWFLRFMTWPMHRQHYLRLLKKQAEGTAVIVAYPLLIWVELEGRSHYINGGVKGFQIAMHNRLDEQADTLTAWMDKLKESKEKLTTPKQ